MPPGWYESVGINTDLYIYNTWQANTFAFPHLVWILWFEKSGIMVWAIIKCEWYDDLQNYVLTHPTTSNALIETHLLGYKPAVVLVWNIAQFQCTIIYIYSYKKSKFRLVFVQHHEHLHLSLSNLYNLPCPKEAPIGVLLNDTTDFSLNITVHKSITEDTAYVAWIYSYVMIICGSVF